jgi:hypothetical protein
MKMGAMKFGRASMRGGKGLARSAARMALLRPTSSENLNGQSG